MNTPTGNYVWKREGANCMSLVCSLPVTPETLHARASRAAERGAKVGAAGVESLKRTDRTASYFTRAMAVKARLFDLAFELQRRAEALRVRLSRSVAQEFLVECAGCFEPYDIEATEQIGNDRFCRGCAHQVRIDAAECMRSDEHDFHYDRGC